MIRFRLLLFAPLAVLWCIGRAQASPEIHVEYDVYAAGLRVAMVDAVLELNQSAYAIRLQYHTTGLAGFFMHGEQLFTVNGRWRANRPLPQRFYAAGHWAGQDRVALIEYENARPIIRTLTPPNTQERTPVPPETQENSVDSVSALALLLRDVENGGRCDDHARIFDGRRAILIEARRAGEEALTPGHDSIFSGNALRCDFAGRQLAGFRLDSNPSDARPLHGSAWFASMVPEGPPLPVRMTFETRWFGDATLFLTRAEVNGNRAKN